MYLLSCFVVVVVVCIAVVAADLELSAPWLSPGSHIPSLPPNWSSKGAVHFTADNLILTPKMKSMKGMITYDRPIVSDSFELYLDLAIEGSRLGGAEGMAIAFSKQPMSEGTFLGMAPSISSTVVILDTFQNSRTSSANRPGIVIGKLDGSSVPSSTIDFTDIELASCKANLRNVPLKLKLKYSDNILSVFLAEADHFPSIPCVETRVTIPQSFYLSLGAATGVLNDEHRVKSLKMTGINESPSPKAESFSYSYHEGSEPVRHAPEHFPQTNSGDTDVSSVLQSIEGLKQLTKNLQTSVNQIETTGHKSMVDQFKTQVSQLTSHIQNQGAKSEGNFKSLRTEFVALEEKVSKDYQFLLDSLQSVNKSIKQLESKQKELFEYLVDNKSGNSGFWFFVMMVQSMGILLYVAYKKFKPSSKTHLI
ncbi:hypothetical protein GEMRC1_002923 [Eukaryota sp. GEM-RC1]